MDIDRLPANVVQLATASHFEPRNFDNFIVLRGIFSTRQADESVIRGAVQFVKEVDDRAGKNHLDEDEKNNNGRVDDGILSLEEFSAAYFDVDDLAAKYCSPIQGKSGKNTKTGRMGKR